MAYQNKILTDEGYQTIIRDKIGLDSVYLPDSAIDRMDGVQLAETIIIERVPDYADLQGDDSLYLKMATIYCVCALSARGFGQGTLRSEKLPDYQYENFEIDMKEKEKDFWDKVDEFLCKISTYSFPEKSVLDVVKGHTEATEETGGTSSPY